MIDTRVNLLKKRRTKIVATLGPATDSPKSIRQLIRAGVNIFRLNMSHGDHETHREAFNNIRSIANEMNETVAILGDLCGPKIRTGKFRDGQIELVKDTEVTLTTRDVPGEEGLIPSQYPGLAQDVSNGNRILIDDGALELEVLSVADTEIRCYVKVGGTLKEQKGINLPGVTITAPSLTEKDMKDAFFLLDLGVDFIALSFIRTAVDLKPLKQLIRAHHRTTRMIAKIEKPEALKNATQIIKAADGIMVARGDLGLELQPEEVPVAQSQLIELARAWFKPVIVATQMLESMIENARPTRAEVTDISYAVTLGTDAVMLSAETAVGAYPLESVRIMDRIVRQTEAHLWKTGAYDNFRSGNRSDQRNIWGAVSNVSAQFAMELKVRGILVISKSGMSAATISSARPSAPVIGITSSAESGRRMALYWGVIPVLSKAAGEINPNDLAKQMAQDLQLADKGDLILLARGFHSNPQKNTPSITVLMI
ncbi:MAG: pyruvate kinase [Gammaproteobacteria bacterium]|nr:pyruvate kinase [Gammaproteobacteria bacterium]NIN62180.1 pyruvate kinase [Gammaproteobacteria bacterium]NIO61918.1 pyruvate kinase [Gammaproteobacteria bacterium]NIP49072.1 pyruvate kinase [Gammaproteobacteria bacterium]NIQ09528.1 pyruvate kinase [Gammaproteobacteria bacterium]